MHSDTFVETQTQTYMLLWAHMYANDHLQNSYKNGTSALSTRDTMQCAAFYGHRAWQCIQVPVVCAEKVKFMQRTAFSTNRQLSHNTVFLYLLLLLPTHAFLQDYCLQELLMRCRDTQPTQQFWQSLTVSVWVCTWSEHTVAFLASWRW